jgi:DNA modification methylase
MSWLVTLVTPPGGIVLDPFAGSGTTLEAARDAGFRAIGAEDDEKYCRLIVQRLTRNPAA